MTKAILATAMVMGFAGPALAQARYDRTLEQAVMEIVARKIDGTLRGSLAWDRKPPVVHRESPALAAERRE